MLDLGSKLVVILACFVGSYLMEIVTIQESKSAGLNSLLSSLKRAPLTSDCCYDFSHEPTELIIWLHRSFPRLYVSPHLNRRRIHSSFIFNAQRWNSCMSACYSCWVHEARRRPFDWLQTLLWTFFIILIFQLLARCSSTSAKITDWSSSLISY
jgi:hypothetical protein